MVQSNKYYFIYVVFVLLLVPTLIDSFKFIQIPEDKDINSLGPLNGNCSRTVQVLFYDIQEYDLIIALSVYYFIQLENLRNASSTLLQITFQLPVGNSFIPVEFTSNSTSVLYPTQFNFKCENLPIPIIKEIGFFSPMRIGPAYYWMFSVENLNVYQVRLVCNLVDSLDWGLQCSFYSRNVITIRISLVATKEAPQISKLSVEAKFLNAGGYIHKFNLQIPLLGEPLQISNVIHSVPWIETQKFALEFQAQQSSALTRILFALVANNPNKITVGPPVYGTPNNSTYRSIINSPFSRFNFTLWEVRSVNHTQLLNQELGFYPPVATNFWPIGPNGIEGTLSYNAAIGSVATFVSERFNITRSLSAFSVQYPCGSYFVHLGDPQTIRDGSYGIVSGTFSNLRYASTILVNRFEARATIQPRVQEATPQPIANTNQYTSDNIPPVLTNLTMIPVPGFNRYIIVRATITDNDSGFSLLYGNLPQIRIIYSKDIVFGNKNDGVYEVVIDNPMFYYQFYHIADFSSNENLYLPLIDPTDLSKRITISNPKYVNVYNSDVRGLIDILSASWSHNDIDVSNSSFSTIFRFAISQPDTEISPYLDLVDYVYQENKRFCGQWNHDTNQFEIPVIIPLRAMTGVVQFEVMYLKTIESGFLNTLFPLSELRVYSTDADMYGPEIQIFDVPSTGLFMEWGFKIYDRLNGFESGNITIVAEGYQKIYQFTFDPANETQIFTISLESDCLSQIYYIDNIYLRDKGGYVSNMDSAFISNLDLMKQRKSLVCSTPPAPDTNPPTLSFLEFTPTSVDVGSKLRDVIFNFTIEDVGNGLFLDKVPSVYITSVGKIIKQQAVLIPGSTSFKAFYGCHFVLPMDLVFQSKVLYLSMVLWMLMEIMVVIIQILSKTLVSMLIWILVNSLLILIL